MLEAENSHPQTANPARKLAASDEKAASIVNGSGGEGGNWVPLGMEVGAPLGIRVPFQMEGWNQTGNRDPLGMDAGFWTGSRLPLRMERRFCLGNGFHRGWKRESGQGMGFHSKWKPESGGVRCAEARAGRAAAGRLRVWPPGGCGRE